MTATEATDVTQVTWDLSHLLDGRDDAEAAVLELLDRADALAEEIAGVRGTVGVLDANALTVLMQDFAALEELLGRAGSYAGLRFATDTTDAARGALMQKVQERSTAIETKLIFFELEWAAVSDDHAEAVLADERLAFCRHHLASARRYRDHLLSEPEE
jgi:oligoendopeptidase F